MRVVYDISFLGRGSYFPKGKSGIFRAIENLTEELVKVNAITAFSSTLSIDSYFESLNYLRSNVMLEDVPLLKPGINKSILDFYKEHHEYMHLRSPAKLPRQILNRFLNNRAVNWGLASKLIDIQELMRADIYHSPFYPLPVQLKKLKHLKKVITIYDLIPLLHPHFFKRDVSDLIRGVISSIDEETWVACISNTSKNDLCNYLPSLNPDRVFVTHLAASNLFYQCKDRIAIESVRAKLSIPEGQYVLSLSTLEPRKNITQTIRSFSRMVNEEQIKDLSLVLVGNKGWDFEPIFDEIAANNEIRDRIIVTGYVPDEDLAPLYSGAMMFVYPSFYEGFGLPPLEAMQCGVPVITSNTSSLPEVVGQAGIMVDPNNSEALCQAMHSVYKSTALRQSMSNNSLEQAGKFSWKYCAEKTIDVYKAAVG